ncbi:MAG: VWA domain-containing protein [Oscillospiraceae bacterium]|nr:VWA domain-containing protein [Oscillospiraceae bacterium]
MKQKLTELVFILDKSGSMHGLEQDTIGGYNSMLEKQKKEEGSVHVTTVLFDNRVQLLHDRVPLGAVSPLTTKEYAVGGTTALLDAVGTTIERLNKIEQALPEDERAEKVIFVITTDGFENASRKYNYATLKKLVESQETELGWEFIFLGANMDAVSEAARLGIRADRSASFVNDSQGIATNYEAVSEAVSAMRSAPQGQSIGAEWKASIDADYQKRGRRGLFRKKK